MTLLELLLVLVAIAAVTSAAASAWAARAAHQSSADARASAELAAKVQRRSLVRDLSASANRVLSEALDVKVLIEELKTEHRMLATASGQSGSSRERLLLKRADGKHKEISKLQEEASTVIEDRIGLASLTDEQLTQSLGKLDSYLIQIIRVKDELGREFAETAGDNRIHRERRMKSDHRRP